MLEADLKGLKETTEDEQQNVTNVQSRSPAHGGTVRHMGPENRRPYISIGIYSNSLDDDLCHACPISQ